MLPEFVQKNYDYGQGFYANMDKYKSVGEFLADHRKQFQDRKNKYKKRKKKLKKIKRASYQEFTDDYDYIEQNGDFFHGVADYSYPLPDSDNKDVSNPEFSFDIPIEGEPVIDIELDAPYPQLAENPGEGVDEEFLGNLEYEENKYYNTQNNGNNIYFYVGSIPNASEILKE